VLGALLRPVQEETAVVRHVATKSLLNKTRFLATGPAVVESDFADRFATPS
jgi:hypothetical protein